MTSTHKQGAKSRSRCSKGIRTVGLEEEEGRVFLRNISGRRDAIQQAAATEARSLWRLAASRVT